MMGNIGLTKSGVVFDKQNHQPSKKFMEKIASELNIEDVLGVPDDKVNTSPLKNSFDSHNPKIHGKKASIDLKYDATTV